MYSKHLSVNKLYFFILIQTKTWEDSAAIILILLDFKRKGKKSVGEKYKTVLGPIWGDINLWHFDFDTDSCSLGKKQDREEKEEKKAFLAKLTDDLFFATTKNALVLYAESLM